MSDQKTEIKLSYGTRLFDHIVATGKSDFNLADIKTLIKEYGQQEFKKRQILFPKGVLPLGKYKGRKISEVETFDPKYLEWMKNNEKINAKYPDLFEV